MKKIYLILTTLLVLSCNLVENSNSVTNITVKASLNDSSRSIADTINTMTLEVTADDFNKIEETSENNLIAISVPRGEERTFLLNIEFDSGEIVTGSKTVDIEGSHQEVNIVLNSLLKSFSIKKVNNSALLSDIEGVIEGNSITIGLPKSISAGVEFDKANLVETAVHSGLKGTLSGNNFNVPVTYDIEDKNGNITTFNVKVFETFKDIKVDNIEIGLSPAEMEPGIDTVDGLIYLSYADSTDKPVIKTYDPKTGIFSENLFSFSGAPASPRYFKVHGTSKDDLYFAYQSGTTLKIYHFKGAVWTEKVTYTTESLDVTFATYNNFIYFAQRINGTDYELNRFNINDQTFEPVFFPTTVYADCATNSLAVESETSIYIVTRLFDMLDSKMNAYYFDGTTTTSTIVNSDSYVVDTNPESIYASGIKDNGYAQIDYYGGTASNIVYTRNASTNLVDSLNPNNVYSRSFNFGNDTYRINFGTELALYKKGSGVWDLPSIWSITLPSSALPMDYLRKPKVLNSGNDIYSIYIDEISKTLHFAHASK